MSHPPFAVTVDLVVLTIRESELCVLLVQRGEEPFSGQWALPGGFVLVDEDIEAAAYRELAEETGVSEGLHLEQLASYGAPDRDPRMRTVSVAWLALAPELAEPVAGTDAAHAEWVPVAETGLLTLAFDHERILADGLERARAKIEYSPLAAAFCPTEFTVGQLRKVYEAVWGHSLDPRNFHRKVTRTEGFLSETGGTSTIDGGRPAKLYRAGTRAMLNPPIRR
ncbi:NUDIX hydrolase [Aeromicrobium terrae]|uniref:NUDIX hydrolase n=1 Tax=Aeromicrobium terrae TaxID=2498846 RepID=UPI001E5766C3|nr:NUDIX domain-containing protein [Aeromicrobium terrae]